MHFLTVDDCWEGLVPSKQPCLCCGLGQDGQSPDIHQLPKHSCDLTSLCPEPPSGPPHLPGPSPTSWVAPLSLFLTDKAWHNSSADSSLKLFPVAKVGVCNAVQTRAPLPFRNLALPVSPLWNNQPQERRQVLKANIWAQKKTREKRATFCHPL